MDRQWRILRNTNLHLDNRNRWSMPNNFVTAFLNYKLAVDFSNKHFDEIWFDLIWCLPRCTAKLRNEISISRINYTLQTKSEIRQCFEFKQQMNIWRQLDNYMYDLKKNMKNNLEDLRMGNENRKPEAFFYFRFPIRSYIVLLISFNLISLN